MTETSKYGQNNDTAEGSISYKGKKRKEKLRCFCGLKKRKWYTIGFEFTYFVIIVWMIRYWSKFVRKLGILDMSM